MACGACRKARAELRQAVAVGNVIDAAKAVVKGAVIIARKAKPVPRPITAAGRKIR